MPIANMADAKNGRYIQQELHQSQLLRAAGESTGGGRVCY
jgi:hypothetical protein